MNKITKSSQYLFETLTEQIRSYYNAAGIAVAIVDKNGMTQYEHYFGCRDAERQLPIDQDTIFGLASVTKSFVALSIMQLTERGIVDLEAPVSRYIPEFTNKNQEPVLVKHFLCHSGGFFPVHRTIVKEIAEKLGLHQDADGNFACTIQNKKTGEPLAAGQSGKAGDLAYSDEIALAGVKTVAEQLDAQTKENGLIGRPGEYMSYCNDGFGLLSEIVHRMGGEKSFADYVKKHILEPLGMDRSGADYLRPRLDENSSLLYKKKDGVMTACHDYYDNAFVLGGAGSMKSTLSDMKKYITMYLNYGKSSDGTRLLSMEGIRAMCRPRIEYRPESWYCYGLATKKLDDLTVVEHGGSLTGVSSNMSWSHDAGAGVMVLCNTSDVPVSVIADAAMRMYHGRDPQDHRDLYEENPWSEAMQKAVLGLYRSGEEGEMEILMKDGEMKVSQGGKLSDLLMVQETLGVIRGPFKDAYLRFYMDEDDNVFAVGYGGRMLPKVS